MQFGDLICFCFLFETINKKSKVDKQRTFDSVTYIFSSHGTHTLTRVLRQSKKVRPQIPQISNHKINHQQAIINATNTVTTSQTHLLLLKLSDRVLLP
jgi:hypothetical protein